MLSTLQLRVSCGDVLAKKQCWDYMIVVSLIIATYSCFIHIFWILKLSQDYIVKTSQNSCFRCPEFWGRGYLCLSLLQASVFVALCMSVMLNYHSWGTAGVSLSTMAVPCHVTSSPSRLAAVCVCTPRLQWEQTDLRSELLFKTQPRQNHPKGSWITTTISVFNTEKNE